MTKKEFVRALYANLSNVPDKELEERVMFYSEMIDDLIEEGYSEEQAVKKIGSVEDISAAIAKEFPLTSGKEAKNKNSKISSGQVLMITLGSPLWISLLVAAFAVVISLYAVIWSVVVGFWAIEVSLWAGALYGIIGAVVLPFFNSGFTAILLLSCAAVCAGLAIFSLYGCKATTRLALFLTKKSAQLIKTLFTGGNA